MYKVAKILVQLKQSARGIAKDAIIPPGHSGEAIVMKFVVPGTTNVQELFNALQDTFHIIVDTNTYDAVLHQDCLSPIKAHREDGLWLFEIIVDVYGIDSIDTLLNAKNFYIDI